jgi:dTDP-6-deoxy-L-talose 4-dehydrogenase (NAD+)
MHIGITGANGFVGRQVLHHLLKENHSLRVIIRGGNQSAFEPNIKVIETRDLFNESLERLQDMLIGVEKLIHLAWYAKPGKYLTSTLNLDCLTGTLRLAEAFANVGGKRFIGIGTCFEYDLNQRILTVNTPLNPKTLYAACKASTFQVLNQLLPSLNVEFAWCRLFYLYGEGEDPRRLVSYLRQKLSNGEVAQLSSGKQIRDFLDVKVAGKQIVEVAFSDVQGAVNICSGIPITVRQLAEQIADEYGRRDLLQFGTRPDNLVDPPCVVGLPWQNGYNEN